MECQYREMDGEIIRRDQALEHEKKSFLSYSLLTAVIFKVRPLRNYVPCHIMIPLLEAFFSGMYFDIMDTCLWFSRISRNYCPLRYYEIGE